MEKDYRGQHQAPDRENGVPLHDTSGVYPPDFYGPNGFRYYADYGNDYDRRSYNAHVRLKDKPEEFVSVHRAIPSNVYKKALKEESPLRHMIKRGDWVTPSKEYAKEHGEAQFGKNYKIASMRVKAKDVFTNGDSIHEWGYDPEIKKEDGGGISTHRGEEVMAENKIVKIKPEPADYIEQGSMKHTHIHPETGGYISAVTRPKGKRLASIIDMYVPEENRNKGVGKLLLKSMMDQFPSIQGQVSSKVAAKNAYLAGRRMAGNENASLEDIYKKIDEDSSVNMWTPKEDGGSITAYHGSPHEFDQFDTSKIGTGEGAQAYGHGLYFAEAEPVAQGYRDALTDPEQVPLHFEGKPLDTPWNNEIRERWPHHFEGKSEAHQDAMEELLGNLSQVRDLSQVKNVLASINPRAKNLYHTIVSKDITKPDVGKGYMYEVHIDAHPDHFLDWDKPLSEQPYSYHNIMNELNHQLSKQKILNKHNKPVQWEDLMGEIEDDVQEGENRMTGGVLHDHLTNDHRLALKPEDASKFLSNAGIHGIRYLDAGSRGDTDQPTHNYVVFDHNDVAIKRKYAEGGEVEYPLTDGEEHLKEMPPQEFLDRSRPLEDTPENKKLVKEFKKDIKKGHELDPLALYKSGKENGRHRATAAKELGVKKVPVHDYRKRNGGAIVDRALMIISKKA